MNIKIDKSDWVKVRLGEVAFEYSKRINNPSESEYDRFVGSSNIGQWDFRVRSWESTSSVTSAMKLFEPNDYLLVRRSLYASDFRERAPRAQFHGVCSGDILTIKENPEYIHDGFLIGILNSPDLWKYVVANGSGSITRRIHWKDLANYEFLLPPMDQQKQIAELLWAGDEMIEADEIALISLKRILEPYLKQIIDTSCPQYMTLGEFVKTKELDFLTGPFGTVLSAKSYSSSGTPIINPTHINDGLIDGKRGPFVPSTLLDKLSRYIMKLDDIVVGRKGEVGRSALIDFQSEGYLVGSDCIRFRVDSERVMAKYLYIYINLKVSQNWFERYSYGTTMPGINEKTLYKFLLPLPSIDIQKEVIDSYNNLNERERKIEAKILCSKSLQKSLINQIFYPKAYELQRIE